MCVQGAGEYAWTDGWSVLHTEWGVDEPVENEGGGCVAMDPIDSKWYDTICISHLQAVCKYTTGEHLFVVDRATAFGSF